MQELAAPSPAELMLIPSALQQVLAARGLLPMPGEGFLEQMKPLGNTDLAYSLWFSWALLRERGQMVASFDQFYLGMIAPKEIAHANQDN